MARHAPVWPTPPPGATGTPPAPEEGHRAGLWAAVGREKARPNEPGDGNTTGSGIWRASGAKSTLRWRTRMRRRRVV